ncbi:MAG: transglutaminase [bacterium]|nr:transglutaminase [bacterium]
MKRYFLLCFFTLMSVVASASLLIAATGDVQRGFPTPGTCSTGLAWDGRQFWLADLKTDSLYAINPENGKVTQQLPAPTFRAVGLTWDGEQLWVTCGEEEKIFRFNPKTGIITRTLDSPATQPAGLAWDGKYLWLASKGDGKIHQISPEDGTTIRSVPAPSKSPQGLAFDGRYLWVSDRTTNRIYMMSPETGDVVLMFSAPAPYADGLAWDGKNLWNADFQSDSLYCLTIGDGNLYSHKDAKLETMEFTSELRNYGPGTVETLDFYLAIPQNLPSQEMLTEPVFSPPPADILTDQWGQKVAHFRFSSCPAGSQQKVVMKVPARLWDTRYFLFPEKVGGFDEIPADLRSRYLIDDEKFDLKNPIIQKAVKQAVGDEKNPYWIMRKIFRYINERMEYQLSGGWNTAPTVLDRGNGSCSEYTFVFLSMCRAAGLPARYAGAITVRGDDASIDDVFHRWAEVYLPNYGWIPVDPSGGDQASPEAQADFIGHIANRYLITTMGGGNSQYLGWNYNYETKWTAKGKCKIYVESIGEWNPIKGEAKSADTSPARGSKVCEP